jgi:precorrin-2 dehydrogenase / sirohydrochlorin ferrochelatase
MKTYPLFALIDNLPCLVVGGGAVGERKVHDLLEAGARVTVVSRELTPALAELARRGAIRALPGDFSPDQVQGMALVIGATDNQEVNARVSAAAKGRGIWVNIVDAPELCTFIVPAQIRRGPLTLAISTGGASPALARRLREDLEAFFGPEYAPYLILLQQVREKVLESRRGHPDNAALFHRLVASPVKEAIAAKDRDRLFHLLNNAVGEFLPPEALHKLVDKALESPSAAAPPPAGG